MAFAQHVLCLFITCPAHFTFLAKHAHKHPLDPSLDSTADVLSLDHGRRKMVWLMKPLQPTTKPWGALDTAAVCVYLFGLFLEAAADQQQWSFQRKKHALIFGRKPREGDFARGFLTSGLFRYTRGFDCKHVHAYLLAVWALWQVTHAYCMCLYAMPLIMSKAAYSAACIWSFTKLANKDGPQAVNV